MKSIVQIFGYMRSGTSMCRRLLHAHPEIYVTNELGRNVYPECLKFLGNADLSMTSMPTTAIRGRWKVKKNDLLREMWLGLSKFDEDPAAAREAPILGNKTPRAEFHWKSLETVLRPFPPRYVYCLRDPRKILRSKLNMHLSTRDFDYSIRDLEHSVEALLDLRRHCPERVHVFSVDEYGSRPQEVACDLLKFLGASFDPEILAQITDQPPANQMSQQLRSREASGEVVQGIVELTPAQISLIDRSRVFRKARRLLDKEACRTPVGRDG